MKPATLDDALAMDRLFADHPKALSVFQQLVTFMQTVGPMTLKATSSRVAFVARTRFAWVHQPTQQGVWLGVLMAQRQAAPGVRVGPVAKRWSHQLKLTDAPDAQQKAWLRQAYKDDTGAGP